MRARTEIAVASPHYMHLRHTLVNGSKLYMYILYIVLYIVRQTFYLRALYAPATQARNSVFAQVK